MDRLRLAHIVSPVDRPTSEELGFAQSISFEAQQEALKLAPSHIELTYIALHYRREAIELPSFYHHRFFLSRSINDICPSSRPKYLPLIAEIMALAAQVDADYYIYSNIDIILQPYFYAFLSNYLSLKQTYDGSDNKYEALIVNRRRIPYLRMSYRKLSAYSTRWGATHPGFDCFLLSKRLLHRLFLGSICVGVPFIGVAMAYNVFAYAQRWKLFEYENLSFHLGMEVYKPQMTSYYWHNRRQFFGSVLPKLRPALKAEQLPYANDAPGLRYLKWALNPSLSLRLHMQLDLERQKR